MLEQFTPREVLIPMVAANSPGAIARVSADSDLAEPHAAQLDRGLSDLLECGLYKAGAQARAASRMVNLSGRSILRKVSEALHVNNPGDIVGLGAENAASAELGLALALLMYRSQTKLRSVLATGALELSRGDRSVPVQPIHHLSQKFRAILRHFEQPGASTAPQILLAPCKDPDGVAIADRYHQEIGDLREAGVEVHGVLSLSDAARLVGARQAAVTQVEQYLKWGTGFSGTSVATAAALYMWFQSPIDLKFVPVANPDGSITVTPARHQSSVAGLGTLPPCRVVGSDTPAFGIGEQVAVSVRVGKPHDLASLAGGYNEVVVGISGLSGPHPDVKVLLPAGKVPVAPGASLENLIPVVQPEEETLLVWLAKRGGPFDRDALWKSVHKFIDPLPPAERLSAARNFLQQAAPGSLTYTIKSVAPGICP